MKNDMHLTVIHIAFLGLLGVGLAGCAGFHHGSSLEESDITSQEASNHLEQLQNLVEEQQAAILQLQDANHVLKERLDVQDEVKDQQLETMKHELESLHGYLAELEQVNEQNSAGGTTLFNVDPVNFDDLVQGFHALQSMIHNQLAELSQLQTEKGQLEQEMSALDSQLLEVERLKTELEQVRKAREIQDAQLAQVNREVKTVGEEITRITNTLEHHFGESLKVTQHQDRLILTLLGQVLFDSGEAELTPLGLQIMKQVGAVLATLPDKIILVEGHTDHNPIHGRLQQKYPSNWELSTARATSVLRYLIDQTRMSPAMFGATGFADTRPVANNDTEEGRARNRRVEIVLYPKQAGPAVSEDHDKRAESRVPAINAP